VIEPISIGDRNTHNKAIMVNNPPTHFSSFEMAPSSIYFSCNTVLDTFSMPFLGTYMKNNTIIAAKSMRTLSGNANIIHVEKLISDASGKVIEYIRTNDKLGGVPIRVEIPPMEQE